MLLFSRRNPLSQPSKGVQMTRRGNHGTWPVADPKFMNRKPSNIKPPKGGSGQSKRSK